MKTRLLLLLMIGLFSSGCGMNHQDHGVVRQRVLVRASPEGVLTLEMKSLNGSHAVGVIASDRAWALLAKAVLDTATNIECVSAADQGERIQIYGVEPGAKGTFCDQINGCRYLFSITARSSASVRIKMGRAEAWLQQETIEVLVMKDPRETEL